MPELSSETVDQPAIAVVVCTYNRADKLEQCLGSLRNQSLDPSRYEIVVVDDCSSDRTPGVAERYATRVVRNSKNLGLAASRNVGVEATAAAVLAFTDDDCVPDRDWLSEFLAAFDDPEALGVGGRVVPLRTDGLLLRYYDLNNPLAHNAQEAAASGSLLQRFLAYFRSSARLNSVPQDGQRLVTVTGANMSLRRTTLESVGGFDERFRLAADDTDLCLRLNELRPGARLLYAPRAVVAHDYNPDIRDALRRCRTYGQAAAFAYLLGRRRLPALFPFPVLIAATIPLAPIDPVMLVIPFALLLLLYPGWARVAIIRRNPAYLGYALLQAILELWTTAGSLEYLFRNIRRA